MAAPPPANPDQIAMAVGLSGGGKISISSDRVAGITKAAATPIAPRATRITSAEPARPPRSAPSPNTSSPHSRAPLRP